jgi:hypothetical protein
MAVTANFINRSRQHPQRFCGEIQKDGKGIKPQHAAQRQYKQVVSIFLTRGAYCKDAIFKLE